MVIKKPFISKQRREQVVKEYHKNKDSNVLKKYKEKIIITLSEPKSIVKLFPVPKSKVDLFIYGIELLGKRFFILKFVAKYNLAIVPVFGIFRFDMILDQNKTEQENTQ